MSIFAKALQDAGGIETPPADPPDPTPPPVVDPPAEPSAPSAPSSEAGGKKKSVPDDVIDPSKAASPKVHDAVAEIQAAELPKNAKKEQIDSFNKLKTKAAEHLQAALDRQAELEKKIGQGDASKTEMDELRKKLEAEHTRASEIEEQFNKVAFEKSPKFQAQYVEQEKTALDLAKSYLDGTDVKQDIIDLAAHATGRKRIEILRDAGVDDTIIAAITPHLANFDTIQRTKQNALANWKTESKNELEAQQARAAQDRQKRAEQENKVWDSIVSKSDLLPLRTSQDNPEWNNRGEELRTRAKEIFNGNGADLPTYAETILKGVAYDVQQEVIDHLRTELQNARAENSKLKSAAPGGSLSAGTNDGAPVDTSKLSPDERAKSTFNQELAKARGS
jgi:hypothetical protein